MHTNAATRISCREGFTLVVFTLHKIHFIATKKRTHIRVIETNFMELVLG